MFTRHQEEYLIRRLNRNEVVLFLGAGFSRNAINSQSENLPVGKELAKKLWEFMYPTELFTDDNSSLQDLYQALLMSGKTYEVISSFLNDNLKVKRFAEFYKYITIPFWYKVYTINIDNLLDKIFERYGDQILDNLIYPNSDFKERDQLLDTLQVNYLHGKLPCRPDQIIFSRTQYAAASIKLQPLYFHFIRDYSNQPTIFVGTALEEQLFEQYISTRQSIKSGITEHRPKSFLVTPTISSIREKVLKDSYNIEVVKGTTEDFLNWLSDNSDNILTKDELLNTLLPTLGKLLENSKYKEKYRKSIQEFAQAFQKIELNVKYPQKKKDYLLGTMPRWADIHYDLDAPRKITAEIFKKVETFFGSDNQIRCIAILGTAGSGKSTVLKRLCYSLVSSGRTVFFSHSENVPKIDELIESLNMINSKVIIAIDNAELAIRQMIKYAESLNKIKFPPIFIIASRTNIFDRISSKYDPMMNLQEYQMPNLDKQEIIDVIKKLDENNLLGYLKGLTENQRIKEFENRAKKQILVAMKEATSGRDFESIMKSEFEEIDDDEGKMLCLCVSLTTEAGFTISKQDYTSFSSKSPAESLDILYRNLKGLVLRVGIDEERLFLRHRTIADFFIENCSTPETLKQAYIRVLSTLASEINASTYGSRKFILYIEIINHYKIYKRFSKNIDKAREVYESLIDYFNDDHHFWLQYGSLELEGTGGNLNLAENYLNQAYSLKPNNIFIKSALAHLYYKKSLLAASKLESDRLKEEANFILLELIKDKRTNDPYVYHIYGKGNYNWILSWLKGRDTIKAAFYDLQKIINESNELYPNDKRLKELKDVIFKAILLTAVDSEDVTFPIIYSDFES